MSAERPRWYRRYAAEENQAGAVNSQGTHVSVVDTGAARRLEQFGVRGRDLRLLAGGDILAVLSRSKIHMVDTTTNSKIDELDVSDLRSFKTTADGAYVMALGKRIVVCISGTTGKILVRLTDFANPVALVVENGSAARARSAGAGTR